MERLVSQVLVALFCLVPFLGLRAQVFLAVNGATYESCSGSFFDTGGGSDPYGDSEDITVTLCPTGGAGTGASASIIFTSFDVHALALGDQLVIHDGTSTADPILATGGSLNNLTGQSFIATGSSGCLTFHWTSDASLTAEGWAATITTGPDAGTDDTAMVTEASPSFEMLDSLGGTPDPNGAWTGPGGAPCSTEFDPDTDPMGEYTYTVSGHIQCPSAVARLQVQMLSLANAGTNGTLIVCATDGPSDLFNALGGAPDPGGTWTAPGGAPHSSTFDPDSDVEGVYTYTVTCTPQPCTDATATVTVTVNDPPNAGSNASTTTCSNAAPFDLLASLGGSPDLGGAWTGPGGTPVSSTFEPGTSLQGVYTYTVLAAPPCVDATATVNVTVVNAPNAGTGQSISVCSNATAFSLITQLGGTPQAGGTWTGPAGVHGPTFNPASDVAGTYTYTVNGTAPCLAATATLVITLQPAPNAGTAGTIAVCSTDASFSLVTELGGTPDGGGTWTAPGGATVPGTFIPGTSVAGIYTYTVAGVAPCANASATVTVTVNSAPNAGSNATVSRCSNATAFNLYGQLGGNPTPGGTWTGPSGASNGTFTPGTSTPGAYTYTVLGAAPCSNATAVVTVTVTAAPNAGTSGSTSVCTNSPSFALVGFLGGSPTPSGTWTAPGGGVNNGTFIPGTSVAGTYTYTVVGSSPCANATATVAVTTVAPPNPGTNGTLSICSNGPTTNLFTLLGGTPTPGGTWTRPNGTAHSGSFVPAMDVGGTYTYTVAGTPPCAAASAAVQVTRVVAPNAGTNGSITVCSTTAPFQLFTVLGGTPNGGGTWRTAANAAFSGTFTPGTTAPGIYKYVVLGSAPCANDTAFVTVVVNQAPNAGTNSASSVCSSQASFSLITRLGGTPNAGGTWTGPTGLSFPGTYIPGTSLQGAYTYTVVGSAPCLDASAVVAITEQRQPVAGTNGSFSACSTDGPVDLFDELGGTPDAGGAWTAPGGGPNSGVFLPTSSAPGIYSYTVTAIAPCIAAVATVTGVVNQAPDAGANSTISVCVDQGTVNLFNALGGTPDAGGTWTDDDNTGQLSGQLFSPAGLPAGNYDFTYTVTGNGQCGDDLSTVRVTIVAGLDAGLNGTLSVCRTNNLVDLFTGLTGTPQPGGQWIDLSGTGAVTGQFFNATLVPGGSSYVFRYKLSGSASCAADSAQVTVAVVAAPNAGTSSSITACSTGAFFNLFPLLGGNPQSGGVWTRGAVAASAIYDPVIDAPGVLTYTVTGTTPCANATATVTVSEVVAPNAGTSASTTVCSNDGAFNMTLRLGGTPQPGSWTLGGAAHGNLFIPGVDLPGVYQYTVVGQSPCGNAIATLTVNVNNAPNAGVNASVTTCSNATSFLLFNVLTGGAVAGGSWTGPNGAHSGLYDPATDGPGDYFYTLTGSSPCTPDVSVVTVFENAFPNAGTSSSISLCAGGASVNLLSALGGTPNPIGTWTGPAPATTPFTGLFVPGTTTPGTYTYTVIGTPPCGNATATVSVGVNQRPNAGISRAITVCSSTSAFALSDSLGGTPSLINASWTPPPPLLTFNGVFNPAIHPSGTYTYTVTGNAPCANATATVTVTVNAAASAGIDADLTVCSTSGAQNMFPLLGTTAQVGGNWTVQPTGAPHSATFLPSVDVSGAFIYTVQGLPGCVSDAARVDVTLNQAPNAGFNGLVTVCDSDDPFQLVNELSGTPQLNGNWQNPVPQSHTGIFVPGGDPEGVYTYTVEGDAPCANAMAQVTVFQNNAPDAGDNGVASVCSNAPPFSLFSELAGTPDGGGVWFNPSGVVVGVTFNPAVSPQGVYKYRIQGDAPCASDSATVTVFVNTAPDAGINTASQICSTSDPVDLVDLLGGTPGPGGSWTYGLEDHGPVFDPEEDESGAYVYTVLGILPCPNAVAQVQVNLVPAPDAGTDGVIAACIGDPAVELAAGLGGTPNGGGTWTDDDITGQLSGGVLNATSLAPGSYHFTYTVDGGGPCADTSAVVTVEIVAALEAGVDASASVCANQFPELVTLLGGSPQPGGFWLDVDNSGAVIGGFFNASQVAENTTWRLDYVLPASSSCDSDTARLTLTVLPSPFAGLDGFAGFCLTDAPGGLLGSLPGGPDANGAWFDNIGDPHSGTFVPATDDPGTYLYVVGAIAGCTADTALVVVEVTQPANAGQNAPVSICSTDGPIGLFQFLGPNAQSGGVWSINETPFSGTYNPAIDGPGVYEYLVPGNTPCPSDVAIITVTEPLAPQSGTSASRSVCSDESPFNMRTYLGGLPVQGGVWTGPGPEEHDQVFNPAVDIAGTYTYVVTGLQPCANDTAQLTISLTPAPNAGSDSTVSACVSQTSVGLFAALGAGAQTGGTWTDLDASGALTGDVFNPSVAGNGTWDFQYAIIASAPCENAFSIITVVVGSGSSAGGDSVLTICGGSTAYALINALAGDPDEGGTWVDQTGTGALMPGGLLNASLIPAGTTAGFTYTVEDAGCGDVQATVQLTISEFPDAGASNALTLCATSDPVELFTQLGGTPETGGTWTGPLGVANNGTFDPAVNGAGPYSYTVIGNAFCPDSVAVISIAVNQPPNAGATGQVVLCDTLLAYPLINGLQGSPDPNGTWTDLEGSGGLTGGSLNTTGLAPGEYEFRYSVQVVGCPDASALVKVDVVTSPDAVQVTTVCNEQDRTYVVTFTIEQGDPGTYEVIGLNGTLSTAAPYTFVSEPIYTSQAFVADVRDANACGTFRVEGTSPCTFEDDVFVPESFSPNGDGINEGFIIPGIEGYPTNTITIFNRWGGEVYTAAGYNNNTVVWDGTSPNALIGATAPTGTYFYVLELGNSIEPITGFIQLVR